MRYTVNLDCKTLHVDRNNEVPILLRISINGKHCYLNTGKKIKVNQYDSKAKTVKAKIAGFTALSSFIESQKQKVHAIMDDFLRRGEIATHSKLKDAYEQETGKVKSACFYDFVERTLKYERSSTSISSDTLDNYDAQLKKLKNYRSKLLIHDIDKTFLVNYKSYLLHTLNQAPNTAYHAMCFLRKYTKKLFDDGKIKPYPFAQFEVGKNFEAEREYLEPEELEQLHKLYESKGLLKIIKKTKSKHGRDFKIGVKYQEVLRYFLVACYCGLRHSDIKTLKKRDIVGDFIVKEMKKGRLERKKTVRIPMRSKLRSLLDLENKGGVLFENPVMETAQTNKYLEDVIKQIGIDKHITFHCARHTFAIVSLIKGMSILVVSDILGHSELTTTQRYAKVVDRLKETEMNKWDDLINEPEKKKSTIEISCPKCKSAILNYEKGSISVSKLGIKCHICGHSFFYTLPPLKRIQNKQSC